MEETLSSEAKKKQLWDLRAKSFKVAKTFQRSSSASTSNLYKFLLLFLLLQSEWPAMPESLREKNNQRLASFNYSLGFVVFCQDQCCLTSHNTLNLLRQSKKYKTFSTQEITWKRTENYKKSTWEQKVWSMLERLRRYLDFKNKTQYSCELQSSFHTHILKSSSVQFMIS